MDTDRVRKEAVGQHGRQGSREQSVEKPSPPGRVPDNAG